ncbi:MAG TPA: sensor histidine kinase [Streptosporangiaceae bacterium]|nr:sensor histidine kinase [Streptosporangiaceae bacterium]
MSDEVTPYNEAEAEAEWVAAHSRWTRSWRRGLMLALPLVYLVYVVVSVRQNSQGSAAVTGYALLAAFAACWLVTPAVMRPNTSGRRFWAWYALLVALAAAEVPFARAAGFVLCVFLTILTVARLGARSAPFVAAMSLAALLVPVAVGSWHVSLAKSFADVTPVAIPVIALATAAAMQVVRANQALAETRAELARLAAENERIRIARDLHDLLGHSLTTITVKAGLARRLGPADPAAAVAQIAEVEDLCRRVLADVRAAVSGYREVTLASELARGRELLRVSGITAHLPKATDVVDPVHQELFGWAVREGLTNVIRHSRARSCAVRVSPCCVEIIDDGHGSAAPPGNGLRGLRERAAAAGGGVDAGPVQPAGWRLRVWVPTVDAPPAVGGTAPAARDTAKGAGGSLLPAAQGR